MLYYKTVEPKTLELLKQLMTIPEFNELNLVGGTSLALQIGHRTSIDLDLFGKIDIDEFNLTEVLSQFDSVSKIQNTKNIKSYLINNIKVDIVNFPYQFIESTLVSDNIRLANKKDIAAMKLAAVTGRGTKKDFIDIYHLLSEFTLKEMLQFYSNMYPDGSEFLVLKSLTYFEDAKEEVMPKLLKALKWDEVKAKITTETDRYIDSL